MSLLILTVFSVERWGQFCLLFTDLSFSENICTCTRLFSIFSVITASLVFSLGFILSPESFADKASGASCIKFAASRSPHLTVSFYRRVGIPCKGSYSVRYIRLLMCYRMKNLFVEHYAFGYYFQFFQ